MLPSYQILSIVTHGAWWRASSLPYCGRKIPDKLSTNNFSTETRVYRLDGYSNSVLVSPLPVRHACANGSARVGDRGYAD